MAVSYPANIHNSSSHICVLHFLFPSSYTTLRLPIDTQFLPMYVGAVYVYVYLWFTSQSPIVLICSFSDCLLITAFSADVNWLIKNVVRIYSLK